MGVDSRLFISNRWRVKDIKDVLEQRFNTKVEMRFHDWAPDYMSMTFIANGTDRMLHVHTDIDKAGFKGIQLGFRANEHGINILKELANTFGGFLNEYDSTDDFEFYSSPDAGNADFLLNEAIKKNPETGSDIDLLVQYLSKEK